MDEHTQVSRYDPRPGAYQVGRALMHLLAAKEDQPEQPQRRVQATRRQVSYEPDRVVITEEHITIEDR